MDGGSEGTREFHQVRAEVILRHWGEKMGGGGGGGREKETGEPHQVLAQVVKGPCDGRMRA